MSENGGFERALFLFSWRANDGVERAFEAFHPRFQGFDIGIIFGSSEGTKCHDSSVKLKIVQVSFQLFHAVFQLSGGFVVIVF